MRKIIKKSLVKVVSDWNLNFCQDSSHTVLFIDSLIMNVFTSFNNNWSWCTSDSWNVNWGGRDLYLSPDFDALWISCSSLLKSCTVFIPWPHLRPLNQSGQNYQNHLQMLAWNLILLRFCNSSVIVVPESCFFKLNSFEFSNLLQNFLTRGPSKTSKFQRHIWSRNSLRSQ